jgi:hypothetical protein
MRFGVVRVMPDMGQEVDFEGMIMHWPPPKTLLICAIEPALGHHLWEAGDKFATYSGISLPPVLPTNRHEMLMCIGVLWLAFFD